MRTRAQSTDLFLPVLPVVLLMLAFPLRLARAQDGHIDPATNVDAHALTFARHADTTFNLGNATSGLLTTTAAIQKCDSRVATDQDVAAALTVSSSGTLGTFGMAGDGLDIITTAAEMSAALGDTTANVKVVTMISFCRVAGTGFAGCAPPGSSMVIVNGLPPADTGETVVHELGHNKGLGHRETPGNPIMKASGFGGNEVNLAETAAYHLGGTSAGTNRPTDLGFIIDDTGSMSEEISGVRNALTAHLGTFSSSDCKAFQLTSFKDSVTERRPTTNLATIGAQVSSLTASGGGDCPEASVQAINQVRGKVKDGARVFFATDASPTAGQSLAPAITALRARGIRVDVLLSGDCVASPEGLPISQSSNSGLPQLENTEGVQSAIEVFSELAEQTGGVFGFIPEVNSTASGAQRYEFAGFNLMQGSLSPTLALATPASAPQGAQVSVTIRGSGTSFQAGTTLDVSGLGLTVLSVDVVSSIELVATLEINPSASVGFRDLTAISGSQEALGVGAFEVSPAVASPTITSIVPSRGRAGATLSVTVLGASTNFGSTSLLDLGSSITVTSLTALSPEALEATILISESAAIGFRDIVVTTGGEVATEALTGPFFVASAGAGGIPILTLANPSSGIPGETLIMTIEGENTAFVEGKSIASVAALGVTVLDTIVLSPTSLMATVHVATEAEPGFHDIRVGTGTEVAVLLDGFLVSEGPPTVLPGIPTLSPLSMALFVALLIGIGLRQLRLRARETT